MTAEDASPEEAVVKQAAGHDFDEDVLFLEDAPAEQQRPSTTARTPPVRIVYSESDAPHKISVDDFCQHFVTRFKIIEKYLKSREDLQGLISISRLGKKQERETCSLIGMVVERSETKNKNIMLKVEDLTGETLVLVTPRSEEAFEAAKELVLDDIIGITGQTGKGIFFASAIALPGMPGREMRKSPSEGYAVFTGDTHIGGKAFLAEDFERFLSWISGESGSREQKKVAAKVKYLFFIGDLVDGIGIYPGQEEELVILEIKQQYEVLPSSCAASPRTSPLSSARETTTPSASPSHSSPSTRISQKACTHSPTSPSSPTPPR
jgi:DNA polymerase II small subunit/DNA polymerase delta subunit B